MPEKQILSRIPLSGGLRRSEDKDPFFGAPGELTIAKMGKFTQEGGFRQHGGVEKITSAAQTGNIIWMDRWYRGEGDTNPWFILVDEGANTFIRYAISDPSSTAVSFVRLKDFTTGVGVDIPAMNNTTYFTTVAMNGWFFLKTNDVSGTDKFYACRVNGSVVEAYLVGAIAPTVAPVLGNAPAGTNLAAGTYRVRYTYVYGISGSGDLGESNPSPSAQVGPIAAGDQINVTVTASTRPDVRAIRIYRQLQGVPVQDPYYFDKEVANAAGPHILNTADNEYGFTNYELELDHDPTPHTIRSIMGAKGRLWAIQDDPRNRIRISVVLQPYVMPNTTVFINDELNIESGPKLTGFFLRGSNPFVCSEAGIWQVSGNEPSEFIWDRIPDTLGFISERSIREGDGLVWGVGARDILVFDGIRTIPLVNIQGLVRSIDEQLLDESIGAYRDRRYYLAVKRQASSVYNSIIAIQREPVPGAENGFAVGLLESTYDNFQKTFTLDYIVAFPFEGDRLFLSRSDGHIYRFDARSNIALAGENPSGPEFDLQTIWVFPNGPYAMTTFHKLYMAIESDGAGGEVLVSWQIMDDDLTAFKEGNKTFDLLPGAGEDDIGIYNFSRYS